jgi:NADH:ubiquinone oxidoreductase subunit 3 (subunit A)
MLENFITVAIISAVAWTCFTLMVKAMLLLISRKQRKAKRRVNA